MKTRRFLSLIIIIVSLFLIIGCTDTTEDKVLNIKADPATFLSQAVINDFDIREWQIIVESTKSSATYVGVTFEMLSISDVAKLSKIGTHELTFTYQGKSFIHTLTITEPNEAYCNEKMREAARDDLLASRVSNNFYLPKVDGSVTISWEVESDYLQIKGEKAIVNRPSFIVGDKEVTLHATFSLYSYSLTKDYQITVVATGMEEIYEHLDEVVHAVQPPTSVTTDLTLLFSFDDVYVSWESSNTNIILIDNEHQQVMVSSVIDEVSVTLKASFTYDGNVYQDYSLYLIKVLPTNSIKQAPTPTNVLITNHKLTFTKVSDIAKYNIYVNGVLKKVISEDSLVLTTLIKAAGNYTIGVQSVASGIYNTDSEIVNVSYVGVDAVGYIGDYYNGTNLTLSGKNLKAALRQLISKTTHATTYEELKTYIPKSDKSLKDASKVVLIYSRLEVKGTWTSGGLYWNREHVWPQSQGWFTTSGAGSDLHHLRPEDPSLNSSRGNKPFGELSTGTKVKVSSANGGITTDCISNGTYFEPVDAAKGDVARIIFYLLTRYTESDSYNITNVAQSINMLLAWNELDPVDDWEMQRNDITEKLQGNRNPFIDYPNFAQEIWG